MTVWVLLRHWRSEGCALMGVYATVEAAQRATADEYPDDVLDWVRADPDGEMIVEGDLLADLGPIDWVTIRACELQS